MEQAAPDERMRAPDIRPLETCDRTVVIEAAEGAWRVCAAHMEPLRFGSAEEAERAARRVARTLCRLGFDTRLEAFDAGGALVATARFAAEATTVATASPSRRALH